MTLPLRSLATAIAAVLLAAVGVLGQGWSSADEARPAAPDAAPVVDAAVDEVEVLGHSVVRASSSAAPVTAPVTTAPVAEPVTPAPVAETWAVVIGADDHHGHAITLSAGIADALATADALQVAFGVDAVHRRLLLGDDVTGTAVRSALDWLVSVAGPEDAVVVSFAGHVETDGAATQWLLLPDGSRVTDRELADALAPLQARQAWFPIAGCFSAGFDELLAPGRILTAASAIDELAYENLRLGHSYLVQAMIVDALATGAATTVEAAFDLAVADLSLRYPDRLPLQFDRLDGDFARLG